MFLYITQKQLSKGVGVNQLVTCGNITDPRIQVAVDVASALTFIFRSDNNNSHNGMRLLVTEINATRYSVRTATQCLFVYLCACHDVMMLFVIDDS